LDLILCFKSLGSHEKKFSSKSLACKLENQYKWRT